MNSDNTVSKNLDDTFLKGHQNSEIYFHNSTTVAIYLPNATTVKSLMQKFSEAGIVVTQYIMCDEAVLHFNIEDIDRVHKILRFQIKGKNEQLKIQKDKIKADKLKLKLKLKEEKKSKTTNK